MTGCEVAFALSVVPAMDPEVDNLSFWIHLQFNWRIYLLHTCTNSSREAKKVVKPPTMVCDVIIVIGVKQRGIGIIIRRGMVMLASLGHAEWE